jgi:hypothetical protein
LKAFVYQKAYLLVPCGHVTCASCVQTVVAKSKSCAECGKGPLKKADLLQLQGAGSGFAGNAATASLAQGKAGAMLRV